MKKPEAPFYLAIKQKRSPDEQIWYMRSPLGKNQLGKFLSDAVSAAGIQSGKRKVCNHSVRKTSIGRLLDANFSENYVMQLSGHKNIQSLSAYKSASLGHQRQMSDALSGRKESATASSRDVNSDDSVKVPSVSTIGYSSSSNALEAGPLTKSGSDSSDRIGSDRTPDRIGLVSSLLVQKNYFEKSCNKHVQSFHSARENSTGGFFSLSSGYPMH